MGMSVTFSFHYDALEIKATYDGSYGMAFPLHEIPKKWSVSNEFEEQFIMVRVEDFLEYFKSRDPGYYALANFIKILTLAHEDTGERSDIVCYPNVMEKVLAPYRRQRYSDCIMMKLGS